MDWMRLLNRKPLHAGRVGAAMGLSVGLHAALGLALIQHPLPPANQEPTSALRLTGGTFDVEAFEESAGSPQEAQSRVASPDTQGRATPESISAAHDPPGPPLAPAETPPSNEGLVVDASLPENAPLPLDNPPRTSAPRVPTPTEHTQPPSTPVPESAPAPATAPSSATPSPPVDPFDLDLPGSAAPSRGVQGAPPSIQSPGGSYGEESAATPVVDLHAAFLKTLPLAAKTDSTWSQLPLGPAGSIIIKLTIDSSLKLAPIAIMDTPEQPAPDYLKRMAVKNRDWLHTQRFSIGPQSQAGTQLLRITATITQKSPDADTPEATGTQALGTRGGVQPTGAYFTYFSGRHVELRVERLGSSTTP